jgi:adenosine kinase
MIIRYQTFIMNLSAPFIAQFFTANVQTILPHIDILIANESEAEAWATATNYPGSKTDLEGIAQSLSSYDKSNPSRPRIVIFTHGDKETVAVSGRKEEEKAIRVPVKPLGREEIVDTNGAGDAFAGGFVAAYVLGKGLEESVLLGHQLAAMCVQQVFIGPPSLFLGVWVADSLCFFFW